MVDPEDVDVISWRHAMLELSRQCDRLAYPEMGWVEWFQTVAAVLIAGQAPGRPLTWTMTLCARRVASDIACRL